MLRNTRQMPAKLAKAIENDDSEFLQYGAVPTEKNLMGINAIMSAKNNDLKGIAHDLKTAKVVSTVTSVSQLDLKAPDDTLQVFIKPPVNNYNLEFFLANTEVSDDNTNDQRRMGDKNKI